MIVLGAGWTMSRFNFEHIRWELRSRQIVHADMVQLLNDPPWSAGRRCGPVTVPNHKLVPDIRYLLDAGVEDEVLPRTRLPRPGGRRAGVALFVTGGRRFLTHPAYGPFDQLHDDPLIQVPGRLPARRLRPLPGGVRQLRLTHAPARGLLDQPPRRVAGGSEPASPSRRARSRKSRSKPSVFTSSSITMK